MMSAPDKREAMRGEEAAHAAEAGQPTQSSEHPAPLAAPSWIWRGLLCLAVVCAVICVTIAIAPELFLPDQHATVVRVRP